MSLARLKMHRFSSAEALCSYVNDNEVAVIEQIVIKDDLYILFYRQEINMNTFAFKCTKCGTIDYSNTTRRLSMRCPKCGAFSMKRDAKDDRR